MFKRILMPTNGSESSERGIERGIELAKLCRGSVTAVHVMQYQLFITASDGWLDPPTEIELEQEAQTKAEAFLAFVKRTAARMGVPCKTVVATNTQFFDAIMYTVNREECDLIVMTAARRKGFGSVFLGSEAIRLLHHSSVPVLTFSAS